MPVNIEVRPSSARTVRGGADRPCATQRLVIGLVNNMPDAALEATEAQFCDLLHAAAGSRSVAVRFSHLPEVVRSSAGLEHIGCSYWPVDELLQEPLDALIVTGAEPIAKSLNEEPYWARIGQLLQWAETHTVSSVWSCLAAHAAAQHLDGIQRRRLERKHCGVFEHAVLGGHPLMAGVEAPLRTPHSRWNELSVTELRAAGYTIASGSGDTSADIFTKRGRSLLVFFQGHPEYQEATLLKEYRRDVGRYLRGQQAHYPSLPSGYFSADATALLDDFKRRALAQRDVELLADFPAAAIGARLQNTWHAAASRIYGNWLAFLADAKKPTTATASLRESRATS